MSLAGHHPDENTEPCRVRRPIWGKPNNVMPRVETPKQRAQVSQQRRPVKAHERDDPLEAHGEYAGRSKAQIDALEKLLHSAMPARITLDNTFNGLRAAVAEEIQAGFDQSWTRGVAHGEWLQQQKVNDLEAKLKEYEYLTTPVDTVGKYLDIDEIDECLNGLMDTEAMEREFMSLIG